MSSKIKKLKDLERKLTVSVPVEDYEKKYAGKLSKIKSTAKLDGFRKGNVPDDVLKQRYGDSIHYEVLNELIQESYPKELQEQNIKPASLLQLVLRMRMLRSLFRIQQCLKFFLKSSQSFLDGKVLKNLKSLWMTQMLIWPLMIF
jgi:hypothetical protein